ncbi:MAG: dicarboxylate/amino acid:cation symporter [Lachnospiraceae bacterium]|nr:dicarboxylate/amino acid:cation symporter [Lachnospiraceae bacterium]
MIISKNRTEIPEAIEYIRRELGSAKGISSAEVTKTALEVEDVIDVMAEHLPEDPKAHVNLKIHRFLGNLEIRISARGTAFDRSDIGHTAAFDDDPEVSRLIEMLNSKVLDGDMTIRHSHGTNIAVIKVVKSKYTQLYRTILALILGLLAGFVFKAVLSQEAADSLSQNLFTPVTTMFLNSLKMVVAPLVLFSIASSIADFGDMKALGRIAGKVIGSYFITSFIAIALGAAVWMLIPIGNPALQQAVSDAASATIAKGAGVSASIKDTIVGIIPSDIVNPFLKADMLQIIFIAAMMGSAAGFIADKLTCFKDVLNDCYLVFSKITSMIIQVMPLAIFCSMSKMVLSMNTEALISVFSWVPTIYFADILMLVIYGLMILVIGRMNPMTFFRKYFPAMVTAFTFAASNPTLPTSMKICDEKLGISKKIYSFSLPLGATINMDGGCITQMISALFLAKIFEIPITSSTMLTLFLAIFVLSVGAPGVPGGALVCISILVPQIGVPAEAISIIMGLYSIVGMMQTCINVTGDAAVTLVVAKSENLLNEEVFRS